MTLDFNAVLTDQYISWMISGAIVTFELFFSALILAFVLAAVLVAIGAAPFRPLNYLAKAFVGYHRNIPTLVQLLVWYFAAPQLLPTPMTDYINSHDSEFILALIALSLYSGAYMSEDMRSGLRALPPTQMEAGRALGLTYVQTMKDILLPQAIRAAGPSLVNQTLVLFKSTSLAMAIGVAEFTYTTRQIENETYRSFETFAIATIFYVVIAFLIMAVGASLERRAVASRSARP